MKLDGSQTAENYAWDHAPCPTPPTDGSALPYGAPSRYGNRVWFKARWASQPISSGDATEINSYVVKKE